MCLQTVNVPAASKSGTSFVAYKQQFACFSIYGCRERRLFGGLLWFRLLQDILRLLRKGSVIGFVGCRVTRNAKHLLTKGRAQSLAAKEIARSQNIACEIEH
jgi:hypothetical protein